MSYAPGTGAFWLDITLWGVAALALPLLTVAVLVTHPGWSIDNAWATITFWFTVTGVGVMAVGIAFGKRTHWRVPDPKVPKTK